MIRADRFGARSLKRYHHFQKVPEHLKDEVAALRKM